MSDQLYCWKVRLDCTNSARNTARLDSAVVGAAPTYIHVDNGAVYVVATSVSLAAGQLAGGEVLAIERIGPAHIAGRDGVEPPHDVGAPKGPSIHDVKDDPR